MIIKLEIETGEFGNAKFRMKEKIKNLSNIAWKFWKLWYIKNSLLRFEMKLSEWNTADWKIRCSLKNWIVRMARVKFKQWSKHCWVLIRKIWIKREFNFFEKVKKHRQTCLLQNNFCTESLILAQNERWRHGLGMQVERCSNAQWRKGEERVSNLPLSWE